MKRKENEMMQTIKKFLNRVIFAINHMMIFFELWGSYHYENRIGVDLAWELAAIFNASNAIDDYIPFTSPDPRPVTRDEIMGEA